MFSFLSGLKNRFWTKPTVVVPRTLHRSEGYDADVLMQHAMFEILTQFVDNELKPTINESYWDENIKTEILSLYSWWKLYQDEYDAIWHEWDEYSRLRKAHTRKKKILDDEGVVREVTEYSSPAIQLTLSDMFEETLKKQTELEARLKVNMHRLVNISSHLWN